MKGNCGECDRRWHCDIDPCKCDEWPDPAPMSNADRIRSMSDEELEEGIRRLSIGYEPWCDHHCKMQGEDNCNMCLKKWLRQPSEEV